MTQANAVSKPEVAIVPPRPDNLHEAIDLLNVSQITGDYRYPALALAGPLLSEVGRIFPLHMILIYLTTSYKRRQVWHAYIAAMFADPTNPRPITDPESVRAKLMNTSSKSLIIEAYGSIPDSYISSLGRLGLEGQEPRIYLLMHKFMSESAEHCKALSHASNIEASTITTLAALPPALQSVKLASKINKPADIDKLVFLIKTLSNNDQAIFDALCKKVLETVDRGGSLSALLTNVYHKTSFPTPALSDSENCRHINSAVELKKAAIQFSNCMKDYCAEAIRGEYQYYRWYKNNRPTAVISVKEDHPFGFRVNEIKGPRNEYLDEDDEAKILKYFEKFGIVKMPSIEGIIGAIGCAMKDGTGGYDPVDNIENTIDQILEDDPT